MLVGCIYSHHPPRRCTIFPPILGPPMPLHCKAGRLAGRARLRLANWPRRFQRRMRMEEVINRWLKEAPLNEERVTGCPQQGRMPARSPVGGEKTASRPEWPNHHPATARCGWHHLPSERTSPRSHVRGRQVCLAERMRRVRYHQPNRCPQGRFHPRQERHRIVPLIPCDIDETLTFADLPQPRFLVVKLFKAEPIGRMPKSVITLS